jgi:Na+/proline symporter
MQIQILNLVAGNLGASGYILSVVLGIPLIYAMLISTAVVLLYTYFGGLFSCAYTDIFHIYLAIVGFWLGFIYFTLLAYGLITGFRVKREEYYIYIRDKWKFCRRTDIANQLRLIGNMEMPLYLLLEKK